MKIIIPHIPKCAGSSIMVQLATRADVHFDYFNHPTWMHAPDMQLGAVEQTKLKATLKQLKDWIVFGHFAASAYDDLPFDYKVLLIREPFVRAVSHFHYIKQLLPDNDVTRRRHYEVGLIKDGLMSIDSFSQLDHIRFLYSRYYLKNLTEDDRLIVLSVEDLPSSFIKLRERCGLCLNAGIHMNRSSYPGNFEHLREVFSDDSQLYHSLRRS
jgi:hypothetical protein